MYFLEHGADLPWLVAIPSLLLRTWRQHQLIVIKWNNCQAYLYVFREESIYNFINRRPRINHTELIINFFLLNYLQRWCRY